MPPCVAAAAASARRAAAERLELERQEAEAEAPRQARGGSGTLGSAMGIRLLGLDLDGTALDPGGKLVARIGEIIAPINVIKLRVRGIKGVFPVLYTDNDGRAKPA